MTRTTRLSLIAVVTFALGGSLPVPPGLAVTSTATAQDDPPSECLLLPNHGACVNCCKASTGLPGKFCSKFCSAHVPPPPSGEPQP